LKEWKRGDRYYPIRQPEMYEAYLEGMETCERQYSKHIFLKYEAYLEGMETFSGPPPLSFSALYEAYLEGMETPAST